MTATRQRVVRERIDPRLTASLFANYRSATDALLELVDNAVDARIDGQPLRIDLDLRAEPDPHRGRRHGHEPEPARA